MEKFKENFFGYSFLFLYIGLWIGWVLNIIFLIYNWNSLHLIMKLFGIVGIVFWQIGGYFGIYDLITLLFN